MCFVQMPAKVQFFLKLNQIQNLVIDHWLNYFFVLFFFRITLYFKLFFFFFNKKHKIPKLLFFVGLLCFCHHFRRIFSVVVLLPPLFYIQAFYFYLAAIYSTRFFINFNYPIFFIIPIILIKWSNLLLHVVNKTSIDFGQLSSSILVAIVVLLSFLVILTILVSFCYYLNMVVFHLDFNLL